MDRASAFRAIPAYVAMLWVAFVSAVVIVAVVFAGAPIASADPMTVCPVGQPSFWNGRPCFPQPCTPPYAPGIPPCFMPAPQIGPNGLPVTG